MNYNFCKNECQKRATDVERFRETIEQQNGLVKDVYKELSRLRDLHTRRLIQNCIARTATVEDLDRTTMDRWFVQVSSPFSHASWSLKHLTDLRAECEDNLSKTDPKPANHEV